MCCCLHEAPAEQGLGWSANAAAAEMAWNCAALRAGYAARSQACHAGITLREEMPVLESIVLVFTAPCKGLCSPQVCCMLRLQIGKEDRLVATRPKPEPGEINKSAPALEPAYSLGPELRGVICTSPDWLRMGDPPWLPPPARDNTLVRS